MSNAMRKGKRTLAGAAAGALVAGLMPFVVVATGVSGASAATLNNTTATVGPVRYSTTASVQDVTYGAPLAFSAKSNADDSVVTADDTIRLTLTAAPSTSARLLLNKSPNEQATGANDDDSVSLADPSTDDTLIGAVAGRSSGVTWGTWTDTADDSAFETYIGVTEGGTYGGNIKIFDGAAASVSTDDSVIINASFSFTTTGKPTSIVFDPTTLSMVASTSDTESVVVSLLDADGKLTQPGYLDSIGLASNAAAVAGTPTTSLSAASFDDTTATTLGTASFKVQAMPTAGTATITGTPAGTISTLTKPTVVVTTSSQGPTAPTSLTVTSPTSQILDDTVTDDTRGYDVNRALVTSVTITGAGATASAGQTVLVSTSSSSWTGLKVAGTTVVDNASATPVLVTADSSGNLTFAASWTSVSNNGKLTIQTGTGSKAKWVVVDVIDATNDSLTSPAGSIVQKTGEATSFEVTLQDSFGNPYVGYRVTGKATATAGSPAGTSSAVGTTDASGKTTVSVPAPSTTFTGAAEAVFTVLTPGGGTTSGIAPTLVNVTYSASGDVTSLSVTQAQTTPSPFTNTTASTITAYPHILVPYAGLATTSAGNPAVYTISTGTSSPTTPAGNVAMFQPSASPANAVTVTVPEGLKIIEGSATSALWSAGVTTKTVATGASVYVFGTKAGTYDVTFTSGSITTVAKLKVSTTPQAAYNINVAPTAVTLGAGAIGEATLTVTDVFGNPVAGTTADDTGGVTVTATGEVLLAGFASSLNLATGADGTARIVIIAGSAAGTGTLALTPAKKSNFWATGATLPTGAPAPVTSAAVAVTVTSSPSTQDITIVGERGTVRGKPGIIVDGVTEGFGEGDILRPWVKFPGQTEYSLGVREIRVDADGEFMWQRRTGKKIYIIIKSEDESVRSNRIIIPAK